MYKRQGEGEAAASKIQYSRRGGVLAYLLDFQLSTGNRVRKTLVLFQGSLEISSGGFRVTMPGASQFEFSCQVGNGSPGGADAAGCLSGVQVDEFHGYQGRSARLGASTDQDPANAPNQFAIDFAGQRRAEASRRPAGNKVVQGRCRLGLGGSEGRPPEKGGCQQG